MSRVDAVRRWLDGLSAHLAHVPDLHPKNAALCLDSTVRGIQTDLEATLDRDAPVHTVFVASSTVFTVALEWCAVLLARGGRVTIKTPRGLGAWYDAITTGTGLPLTATMDRSVLHQADRVVLMGSDATVEAVRAALDAPERLLAFGTRHSVAWFTDPMRAEWLALDTVLYDGRGCMSPCAVYSPIASAADLLANELAQAREVLPLGTVHPEEAAWIRERRMLAKVTGRVVSEHVIELPPEHASPRPTPGVVTVHPVGRFDDVPIDPDRLSVLGSDRETRDDVRTVPLGRMQRPALDRLHDGVAWLDVV